MLTHFDTGHDHTLACGTIKVVNRFATDQSRVTCAECWMVIWADLGLAEGCGDASLAGLQAEVRGRLNPRAAYAQLSARRATISLDSLSAV
jgi:hypothetical protein